MSTLSTHVLDTAFGRPAPGVPVVLEQAGTVIARATTDADGRVREFMPPSSALSAGVYVLRFDVASYFASGGRECFYPEVAIAFRIGEADEHYHVPLLLSPFAYSTYRGS